ncbi:MAG: sortase [Patescibacteria group bacterium]|nr:sortase [Patescibacteria group bacterium]
MFSIRSIQLPEKDYLTTLSFRTIGNFMVLTSLYLIGKTLYQPVFEEIRFFINDITRTRYTVEAPPPGTEPEPGRFARMFGEGRLELLVPEDPEYSLVIPKIGANARIVPNVNAGSEEAYQEALKRGIAHAAGTAFPGEGGHIFLFAHSTDYIWNIGSYNAVFYLLYKLEPGDEVNVFYRGKRHRYTVREKKIIEPSDVHYLTRKTERETLSLQTCWPPGTTLKRLIVHADAMTTE